MWLSRDLRRQYVTACVLSIRNGSSKVSRSSPHGFTESFSCLRDNTPREGIAHQPRWHNKFVRAETDDSANVFLCCRELVYPFQNAFHYRIVHFGIVYARICITALHSKAAGIQRFPNHNSAPGLVKLGIWRALLSKIRD